MSYNLSQDYTTDAWLYLICFIGMNIFIGWLIHKGMEVEYDDGDHSKK